jgi:hypothetical protein
MAAPNLQAIFDENALGQQSAQSGATKSGPVSLVAIAGADSKKPSATQMRQGPAVKLVDDFHDWLLDQASALRNRQFNSLDCDNLAEELEAMAADHRREVRRHLKKLLLHLLKLKMQPHKMEYHNSWRASVREAREEIEDILEIAPGLFQGKPEEVVEKCYARARVLASEETGLRIDKFDQPCPWSFDQMMRADFFPKITRA